MDNKKGTKGSNVSNISAQDSWCTSIWTPDKDKLFYTHTLPARRENGEEKEEEEPSNDEVEEDHLAVYNKTHRR